VPIRDYTRTLVGTLAVVGPGHRLTDGMIEREIVPSLLRAGEELSRRLGFAA
jgi:IclR family transcriptional regulator, KDG regulon repressor